MTPREEKITPPVRDSKGTEDSFMDRDDVNDDMPSIKVDNEDTMHPKKSDNKQSEDSFMDRDEVSESGEKAQKV